MANVAVMTGCTQRVVSMHETVQAAVGSGTVSESALRRLWSSELPSVEHHGGMATVLEAAQILIPMRNGLGKFLGSWLVPAMFSKAWPPAETMEVVDATDEETWLTSSTAMGVEYQLPETVSDVLTLLVSRLSMFVVPQCVSRNRVELRMWTSVQGVLSVKSEGGRGTITLHVRGVLGGALRGIVDSAVVSMVSDFPEMALETRIITPRGHTVDLDSVKGGVCYGDTPGASPFVFTLDLEARVSTTPRALIPRVQDLARALQRLHDRLPSRVLASVMLQRVWGTVMSRLDDTTATGLYTFLPSQSDDSVTGLRWSPVCEATGQMHVPSMGDVEEEEAVSPEEVATHGAVALTTLLVVETCERLRGSSRKPVYPAVEARVAALGGGGTSALRKRPTTRLSVAVVPYEPRALCVCARHMREGVEEESKDDVMEKPAAGAGAGEHEPAQFGSVHAEGHIAMGVVMNPTFVFQMPNATAEQVAAVRGEAAQSLVTIGKALGSPAAVKPAPVAATPPVTPADVGGDQGERCGCVGSRVCAVSLMPSRPQRSHRTCCPWTPKASWPGCVWRRT